MAAAGLQDGLRAVVTQKHDGPAEEAVPEEDGDQAKYMVKGQKCQLLQAALIVLCQPGAVPEEIFVGQQVLGDLLAGVKTHNLVHGSGRGGKGQLVLKNMLRHGLAVLGQCGDIDSLAGQRGRTLAEGVLHLQSLQDILRQADGVAQIDKIGLVTAHEDGPERCDPLGAVVHFQSNVAAGRSQLCIQSSGGSADLFVHLGIGIGIGIGAQTVVALTHHAVAVVEGVKIHILQRPGRPLQALPVKAQHFFQFRSQHSSSIPVFLRRMPERILPILVFILYRIIRRFASPFPCSVLLTSGCKYCKIFVENKK